MLYLCICIYIYISIYRKFELDLEFEKKRILRRIFILKFFQRGLKVYLIGLTQAVDTAHFTLLIGITKDAHGRPLPRYAQHEVLSVLLRDILSQLAQKPRGPFLFHLQLLVLQQRSKIN